MYINSDEYPPCGVRPSINANIQCDHGYAYSSSKQKMYKWVN